jgi:hypothetical protein
MSKPEHTFFKKDDIINRFNYDISEFKRKNTTELTVLDISDEITFDSLKTNLGNIIAGMALNGNTYIHQTHVPGTDLNSLWVLRTQLFECILLMTTLVVSNESDFNIFKQIPEDLIGKWREDMKDHLHHFKLGIFGSMEATSDIDLSIQYCNPDPNNFVAGLMYINRIIENLFIAVTGFTSLDFDIECYGTIIFQFDSNTKKDVYYLDCNLLEEKDYKQLLPYAFASIYRNCQMPTNGNDAGQFIRSGPPPVTKYGTYDTDFYKILKNVINKLIRNKNNIQIIKKSGGLDLMQVLEIPSTLNFNASKLMVDKYFNPTPITNDSSAFKIYNAKRRMYYTALENADTTRKGIYKIVQSAISSGDEIKLPREQIIKVIIGEATFSLYREESYLLAPTIMHVVRTLQLKSSECENNPSGKTLCILKYQTTFPDCKNKGFTPSFAYCDIGKYGYFLSILEQIGYMWRFYNQYCVNVKTDESQCRKKLIKYGDRFSNGIIASFVYMYSEFFSTPGLLESLKPSSGGKRRTERRTKRKTKRRLRFRKTRHLKSSYI